MRRARRREKARVYRDPVVGRIVNHSTVLFAMDPAFGLLVVDRQAAAYEQAVDGGHIFPLLNYRKSTLSNGRTRGESAVVKIRVSEKTAYCGQSRD
jgi:hypothetical protein